MPSALWVTSTTLGVYRVCCDTWGTPMMESDSPWLSRFRALRAIHHNLKWSTDC